MRVVVALGGNALLRRGDRPDSAIQIEHIAQAAPALAKLAIDHQLVLANAGLSTPVVTLVTQTVVDADDPAFRDPTKFVGIVYDSAAAHELADSRRWTVRRGGGG